MLRSPTSPSLSLSACVCERVCADPTAANTQTGEHLAPLKAVSGNFTLSHACSHVGLPRANSLPVSAPSGGGLALNKPRRRGGEGVCRTKRGGEKRQ